MYNNTPQYHTSQAYQNTYPHYGQNYNAGYNYEGYTTHNQPQPQQYMPTTNLGQNMQPVPPGEEYPQNNWTTVGGYHSNSVPAAPVATSYESKNEDEGVAQERKAQNAQLIKQREEYVRKAGVLRRELELLRNQKHEIMSENSSQRDMDMILKENTKLQDEIQTKMKAIYNVIEMLSSIIKDGRKVAELEAQLDQSPKVHKHSAKSGEQIKYNYMHYDPELHWCRMCDEFPKTAKDFLLHLQSDKHRTSIQENDVGDNTPWHKLPPEMELPTHENAPKKRIPIRGLQFFISAPSWYCKLCDTWIGDLHCASHHLKSQAHFQNYANFVEQNPHWEIEWLKDREKAMARSDRPENSSDSDESEKRRKRHRSKRSADPTGKDKKKKRKSKKKRKHSSDSSSSSSSSESSSEDEEQGDKTKSIRVVMRNMKVQSIMNEDLSGKWEMLEKLVGEHKKKEELQRAKDNQKKEQDDTLINQWMTVSEPPPKEKLMLDNLKDRMKQKQELERQKYAEMEKRQREKELEEREFQERKQREEQENKEKLDRERRERDREEYERIRDKERNAVRFKTNRERDHYRKRRSPSRSPEREKHHSPREDRRFRNSREQNRENGRGSTAEHRRSRSRSQEAATKRKPTGPPPNKRLPFIGRMPLFKNRKVEDKSEKEIKKEEYDVPRQTRFQPGNLAKAFLPQPDVVCFPKLSSYPPISAPPPPPVVSQPDPPAPPKITQAKVPKPPPAPKIGAKPIPPVAEEVPKIEQEKTQDEIEAELYGDQSPMMNQYYSSGIDYNSMYSHMYDYSQYQGEAPAPPPPEDVPLSHTMPLQPPPLPPNDPNDDLAMLGISADDMAAQSF